MCKSLELSGHMLEEELKHSWYDWHLDSSVGSLGWKTTTHEGLCITFRRLDFIPRTRQLDEWGAHDRKRAEGVPKAVGTKLGGIGSQTRTTPFFLQGFERAQNQFCSPCCVADLPHHSSLLSASCLIHHWVKEMR